MEQQCGRKIGLLPTKAQIRTMYRMCAVSRRAYNWKLAVQNQAYEEAKKNTPEGEKVKCKLGTPRCKFHGFTSGHRDGVVIETRKALFPVTQGDIPASIPNVAKNATVGNRLPFGLSFATFVA